MRKSALVFAALAALACAPGAASASGADDKPLTAAQTQGGDVRAQAGWVRIRSLYGNRQQCLDADATNGANGTKVQVWECNGTPQQAWYSTDDGYLINGRFQNKCLDADTNGGGANGTKLQLWDCNLTSQQRWWFFANDLAMYNERFMNNRNTVVDRDINGPSNGAKVQLWQKNFQPQQWWQVF